MEELRRKWWKEAVVYQIYPRSFKDSNRDGIGDLQGIISELDYLLELGVDVIWLSPVYKSPNEDGGYDISDYRDIMAEFGTMQDMDQLIREIHQRGLKLVMDLVVNHTSDEHEWFVNAKKSKDNPYRDYYIWRPPKDGKEPNNWASPFGGSCWEYDAATGEYYFHFFARKQPDLNWDNARVRGEVFAMMEYWIARGVDGFRMDVINVISKPADFPDAPVTLSDARYQPAGLLVNNGPRFLEYMGEMKQRVLSKHDLFTVGETHRVTPQLAQTYVASETGVLNTLFHFELMGVDKVPHSPWGKWDRQTPDLLAIKAVTSKWQTMLDPVDGWNSLFLENHDMPRAVSRFGNDTTPELRDRSAKMLATWLLLLKGTPYIYQGQELGMPNAHFERIEDYRDIETLRAYEEMRDKRPLAELMAAIKFRSRDNGRTPMPWNDGPLNGFSGVTPWIGMNSACAVNVQSARNDAYSVLHYYRRLIRFRKEQLTVLYGTYELILPNHTEIYAYARRLAATVIVVICNFFGGTPVFEWPAQLLEEVKGAKLQLPFSNCERQVEVRVWVMVFMNKLQRSLAGGIANDKENSDE